MKFIGLTHNASGGLAILALDDIAQIVPARDGPGAWVNSKTQRFGVRVRESTAEIMSLIQRGSANAH